MRTGIRVDKWTVSAPRFVKKQGQRIHWATRFEAALSALKAAEQHVEWLTGGANLTLADLAKPHFGLSPSNYLIPGQPLISSYLISAQPQASPNAYAARFGYGENVQALSPPLEDQVVGYGTASLNTSWSLAVTTSGALTKPKLESVDFVEFVWTSPP